MRLAVPRLRFGSPSVEAKFAVPPQCVWLDSPLGSVNLVTEDGHHLSAIRLLDRPESSPSTVAAGCEILERASHQLAEYFAGRRQQFDLPLQPAGTPFQQRVWQALQQIPFGTTASYQEIARAIGQPTACRAVGGANGRNPLPIVIPCHRVIGVRGALVGFSAGLDRKVWLLGHEAAFAPQSSAGPA
jgi:methylated-DNA-[protein]-cysteine S-methyltransferase